MPGSRPVTRPGVPGGSPARSWTTTADRSGRPPVAAPGGAGGAAQRELDGVHAVRPLEDGHVEGEPGGHLGQLAVRGDADGDQSAPADVGQPARARAAAPRRSSGVQETRAMPAARSRATAVVNCSPSAVTQARNPCSLAGSTPSPPSRSSTSASGPIQPARPTRPRRPGGRCRPARAGPGSTAGDTAAAGGLDDPVDGEIGLRCRRGPEQHRVVGQPDVPGRTLGLRVDGDGLDPQPGAGSDDGAGRRPTTGHQHALDTQLCHARSSSVPRAVPRRTRRAENRSAP